VTVPATGATSVDVDTPVEVDFSEAMNPSTVSLTLSPAVTLGAPTVGANNTSFVFKPTSALAYNTVYTATASGSDVAGNALSGLKSFSFTTEAAPDTAGPTVTFAPTGTSAALDSNIVLTFNEAVETGSVDVTLAPAADVGEPSFSDGNKTATFNPSSPLTGGTAYTATVVAKDVAGNSLAGTATFTFTTAAPADTTRPYVTATYPTDAGTPVAVNADLFVLFSEAMNTAATASAVSLQYVDGGVLSTLKSWTVNDRRIIVDPTSDLAFSTSYDFVVGAGSSDVAGNVLDGGTLMIRFTTSAAPDVTGPRVSNISAGTSYAAPDGGRALAGRHMYTIDFNEDMDNASVEGAVKLSQTPAKALAYNFVWPSATRVQVWLDAGTAADFGSKVTVVVGAGAKDTAKNSIVTTFPDGGALTQSHGTLRRTAVTLYPAAAQDGYTSKLGSLPTTGTYTTTGMTLKVGDDRLATGTDLNDTYRGMMSFDLGSVATSGLVQVNSANLTLFKAGILGNPGSELLGADGGVLVAEHVYYGTAYDQAYTVPVLTACTAQGIPAPAACADGGLSSIAAVGPSNGHSTTNNYYNFNVRQAVNDDINNRGSRGSKVQLRLKGHTDTQYSNTQADQYQLYTVEYDYKQADGGAYKYADGGAVPFNVKDPRLSIDYLYP
jgi:hypothetical protein